MKRTISVAILAMVALSLVACTGLKKESSARIKCPACGYEFEIPQRDQSKPKY